MRKAEKEIIIASTKKMATLAERIIQLQDDVTAMRVLENEIRILQMWAEAPDLCGGCKGETETCDVCGGRAFIKLNMKRRK